MFCWHDWVIFEKPNNVSERFHYEDFGHNSLAYLELSHNGLYIGRTPNLSKFSNLTCSKCHRMKMNLDKAFARATRKAEKVKVLEERRNAAKLFANKFSDRIQE